MFLVALGVVVAGIALAVLVRRWRRTPVDAASVAVAERRDALDELIDAELSDLDG
jgi:type VI protein secretion system component VasK